MIGSKFITTNTIQLNKPNNHRASLDLICHGTRIKAIFGLAFPPLPLAPLSHNRAFKILGSHGSSNRWGQQEQSYAEPFELFQVRKKKKNQMQQPILRRGRHIFLSTTNSKEKAWVSPSPHLISVIQQLLEGKEAALAINCHIGYLRLKSMPNWPSQIPIFLKIV